MRDNIHNTLCLPLQKVAESDIVEIVIKNDAGGDIFGRTYGIISKSANHVKKVNLKYIFIIMLSFLTIKSLSVVKLHMSQP